MGKQQIKIEFKTIPNISIGDICNFKSKDGTTSFKAIYISDSRIDKYPMFMITHMPIKDFTDYELKGCEIKDTWLIRQLNDIDFNNNIQENKDKIVDYLFKLHNINDDDLKEKDAYKSIIRDIKFKSLI